MIASNVQLGSLRTEAIDRADMEYNPAISIPIWNQYISKSYKRLYNMLVGAYGNDYFVAPLFQFNLGNSQYYPLPDGTIPTLGSTTPAPALYKLLGVDLQYSASPTGFVTLKRFEEIERNKYAYPNTTVNMLGYTNLRYRQSGSNIEFIPIPMASQLVQLKYIPQPNSLQFVLTCSTTISSPIVQLSDVTDLSSGMSAATLFVQGSPVPNNATILSINTSLNQVTLSANCTATTSIVQIAFWTDAVTFSGVAGWEEYVIVDAAIKAGIKQENPVDELREEKAEMVKEIEALAEGRDAGQAHHVSDALGANSWSGVGDGDGYGDGGMGY